MSKIKKIIVVLLVTVIFALQFSVSALKSNGSELTLLDSSYGQIYGATNTDCSPSFVMDFPDYELITFVFPNDNYNELVLQFSFNSSCMYGSLTFYVKRSGENTEFIYNNVQGVYTGLGQKLNWNYEYYPEYVKISYSGLIPSNFSVVAFVDIHLEGKDATTVFATEYEFIPDTSKDIMANQDKNTDKIIQNQDENADKIVGAIEGAQEQEKQEANSSGNSAMDSVTSIIPNYAGNLSNYFTALTKRMIHEDMTCFITFPQIKIPAINGFFDEKILSEEKTVNMSEVAGLIPQKILYLVRYLLTLFLIIFCFKELYSIIQYILTLKGGNLNE